MTNNVVSQDEIIWQNEVLEMAKRARLHRNQHNLASNPVQYRFTYDGTEEALIAFAKLVEERTAAKEREACLKICEAQAQTNYWEGADVCAEDIRARGETTSRGTNE